MLFGIWQKQDWMPPWLLLYPKPAFITYICWTTPVRPLQWFFERPRIHRATHILIFISWELSAETTLIVFAIVFPSVNTGALSHDERINLADKKYPTKEQRRKKIKDSIQNAQW